MAEVTPPRWAVHPMRVIFMVSRDPPPRLADKDRWSLTFQDFVAQSLQKVGSCSHEAVCVLFPHLSAILMISGGAALLKDCTRDMHACEIQQQVWSMLLTQAGG